MNINKAIRELYEEKKRLDRVIASLEEMQRNAAALASTIVPEKRRGRKFMDPKARQEVSERMKRYWDARRKQEQAAQHGKS
jgi:hypothetical protein